MRNYALLCRKVQVCSEQHASDASHLLRLGVLLRGIEDFVRGRLALKFGALFGIGSLALAGQTSLFNADAIIARRGFSAIEFVASQPNGLGFDQDFPGGARVTTSSSPLTWLHLFANQLGVDSLVFYYIMVALEIVTLLIGAYVFWGALKGEGSRSNARKGQILSWPFVILSALLLLSNGQMMNIGRFGFPFFHGQFYGFADGLRLAAIGLALRRRWWESALLLSAAFVIHPIKALFGAVVVLVVFCFSVSRRNYPSVLKRLSVFPIVASTWSLVTLTRPEERIELSEFVAWTRVFQSHWYPLDLGVFTSRQLEYFAPFAFVVIASLLGVIKVFGERKLGRSLYFSVFFLTGITFVGVAVSVWPPSEFLVKLSLIRASELVVLLALPMMLYFAIHFFRVRKISWASLYSFPLVFYFLPTTYLSALSLLVLAIPLFSVLRERQTRLASATLGLWGTFLVIHLFGLSRTGDWAGALWGLGVGLSATVLLLFLIRFLLAKREELVATVAVIAVLGGGILWSATRIAGDFRDLNEGRQYLDVQQWARGSTSETSLFMVDPCINYGWRDFSGRASIGTPREWFMTGWGYSGDGAVLELGKEIAVTVGLVLDPEALGPQSSSEVCRLAREAYYAPGLRGISAVSEKFGVDYAVLYRERLDEKGLSLSEESWQVVFENETFLVIAMSGPM